MFKPLAALAALAALGALAGPAAGEPEAIDFAAVPRFPAPRVSVITPPSVITRPTPAQAGDAYPRAADKAGINGQAAITCTAGLDGRLSRCRVLYEAPEGHGFGAALLKLAPHYVMKPADRDGEPIEYPAVLQVAFRGFPDAELPPPMPRDAVLAATAPQAEYSWRVPGEPAPADLAGLVMPTGDLWVLGFTGDPWTGPLWSMSFVLAGGQVRHGNIVEATWLRVAPLAYEGGPPPSAFSLSRVRVDCRAWTLAFTGSRNFDADGGEAGWQRDQPNLHPISAGYPLALLAAQVCGKEKPRYIVHGAADALKTAEAARAWLLEGH